MSAPSPKPLLLKGARLVDPSQGLDAVGDLLVVDGKVAAIGGTIAGPDGARVVNCAGQVVAPGMIDVHVPLREPGREDVAKSGGAR